MLTERHIYGSSRLGIDTEHVEMVDAELLTTNTDHRTLGLKQYELSNHLGNVLSVISDMKLPVVDAGVIVSYTAVVVSATDYSAFGVALYGRSWSSESYRYGFNGQEKEKEITGTETHTSAEFWMYDSRLGRRWQLDPCQQIFLSDYSCFGNNPIVMSDFKGAKFGDSKSENQAKNAEKHADKRIKEANKELTKQGNRLFKMDEKLSQLEEQGKIDTDKYNRLSEKRATADRRMDQQLFFRDEMTTMKAEINEMREHDQIFILEYVEGMETQTGRAFYDLEGNAMVMQYSDMISCVDELKAGHQFIKGEISFDGKTGEGGVLLDLYDEQASYLRSWAADPSKQRENLMPDEITIDAIFKIENMGERPYENHFQINKNMFTHGQEAKDAEDFYWEQN
jgi:RHS repeat-associated protein